MRKTLWKLFPFASIDSKAAEEWLNQLGRKGWRLRRLRLGVARFRREMEAVSYAVTLERGEEPAFRTLCRDAGWAWTAHSREMDIYCSLPGRNPAPMETDGALESRRFFRGCLELAAGRLVLPLLAAGVHVYSGLSRGWQGATRLEGVSLVLFPLLLAGMGAVLFGDAGYLLRIRRTGEVAARPMAGIWLRWWGLWALTALAVCWLGVELLRIGM